MLGKLSVALLLAAAPAVAAEPASEVKIDESGQAYRTKKVCRTVEVAGSFIPRTSCVTRKIPIKKPDAASQETAKADSPAGDPSGQEQKEQ